MSHAHPGWRQEVIASPVPTGQFGRVLHSGKREIVGSAMILPLQKSSNELIYLKPHVQRERHYWEEQTDVATGCT